MMSLNPLWRRRVVSLCFLLTVLVNIVFIAHRLHASPPRFLHAHGGLLPRVFRGGWVPARDDPCHPGLRFLDPPGVATALGSVPGSGNTWVRHLLQQATGVATGSSYYDEFLKQAGFSGEGISNGSVLVVKTHSSDPDVHRHFRRAILLVRHPRDAIVAEFNRQHGGHLGFAKPQDFEEKWANFWPDELGYWTKFNMDWLHFEGPLHVVHFQDLRVKLNSTLSDLLQFVGVAVPARDLQCAMQHSQYFKRRRKERRAIFDEIKQYIFATEVSVRFAESEARFRTALAGFLRGRRAGGESTAESSD